MEYLKNLEHINKIHFVGIGGASMSALAKLCLSYGKCVTGSDIVKTQITSELMFLGAQIYFNHSKKNISDQDMVVYTSAVKQNNIELLTAKEKGITILERNDFLKIICENYKNVIAVGGTHGKTTTTAMISSIFIFAGKKPTVHLGGFFNLINGNLKIGEKQFFITEACEYEKHLLKIPHNVGVILNIEYDHPDSYNNVNELYETFSKFSATSKNLTVINENYTGILNVDKFNYLTFGESLNCNFSAKNIKQYKNAKITFDCFKHNEFFANITLNCYGTHNVLNALCSIAVADYYNISKLDIILGLKAFNGVKRRFEYIGKINDNIVIEDYAHHPTEISSTLKCAKQIFKQNLVVVFQPHTYSRTKHLLTHFMDCFNVADKVYVLPTYSAREQAVKNSSGKYLANKLKFNNKNAKYCNSFKSALKSIKAEKNCVILILGAGDIDNLASQIKKDYINNINK